MKYVMIRLFILGGLLGWFAFSGEVTAQKGSMNKNMTGPTITVEGLKTGTSSRWKQEKTTVPSEVQFTMTKTTGDKTDATFSVKPGLTGSDEENIKKWQEQFEAPKGKTIEAATKVTKSTVSGAKVVFVDIQGAYKKSESEKLPDYRMYAVIVENKGNKSLILAVGPKKTMTYHKSDFGDMVKGLGMVK